MRELADAILQEPDLELARLLLETLPEGVLARAFQACFKPHDPRAARLVRKPLKRVQDEDVLNHLERIHAGAKETLAHLLEVWMEASAERLEALAQGEWNPAWAWPTPDWWRAAATVLERLGHAPRWAVLAEIASSVPAMPAAPDATEVERLQGRIGELEDRIQRLKKEKRRLAREHEAQEKDRAAQARAALKDLEAERDAWRQQAERHQEALRQAEQIRAELERRLQDLQEAAARRLREAQELREQYRKCARRAEDLQRENERLQDELEQARAALQTAQVTLSGEALERAWIIPYEELGGTSRERLIHLIEVYQAALDRRPNPLLHERTNWAAFSATEPEGVLLLGAERLLWDLACLPIARLLRSEILTKEALFYALTHQYLSPRLEEQR